jgi:hypothetical protein
MGRVRTLAERPHWVGTRHLSAFAPAVLPMLSPSVKPVANRFDGEHSYIDKNTGY